MRPPKNPGLRCGSLFLLMVFLMIGIVMVRLIKTLGRDLSYGNTRRQNYARGRGARRFLIWGAN